MQAPTQQQQYESNIVQILSMQRNQAQDALVDVVIRVNGEDRPAQRPVLVEVQPAEPAQPAVQAREAYTETVREAGNRYSLRLDQLAWFVATAGA